MFKKIKEFFAAEKYEEEIIEDNIRPEYKDNLGICSECGWVFKLDDGKPIVEACGMYPNHTITYDEFYSISFSNKNELLCERCIFKAKQFKAAERLKMEECKKLADVSGLEMDTVVYFIDKLGG